MEKIIYTPKAPKPVGPYSQAVLANGFLFLAGQIPLDPITGELVSGSVKDQVKRIIENIKAVVEEAGGKLSDVVKATVFLKNLDHFSEMNEVYSQYFGEIKPARTTIEISRLPKGADVEIEVVAALKS